MFNLKFWNDNLVFTKDIWGKVYSLQPSFILILLPDSFAFFAFDTILLSFQSYHKLDFFFLSTDHFTMQKSLYIHLIII